MKKFDEYKTKMLYPLETNFVSYVCGDCETKLGDYAKFCFNCGSKVKDLFVKQETEYKNACADYKNDVMKLFIEFKDDLLLDFGLNDHPKANLIFDYCNSKSNEPQKMYDILNELYAAKIL